MFKLVIEDDEGKRTTVPLSREDYAIGRKEGNTIRLTERNVSRDHVRLQKRNGGQREAYWLEDLASYNGVYVNGLRVAEPQELLHGDLIQIGDYRILYQDDVDQARLSNPALDSRPMSSQPNVKATIPINQGTPFRGSLLMERPNRLVMLVGPTPGTEYPLDRERMTIGRAEDASISVNHNSVSRLHCEIHALGEGRFEIVDKGSANGVRVNGADLRRGIIEAGDLIELGDVRFKFVAAGQVFVAGPNESQQLGAIGDREAPDTQVPQKGSIMPFAVAGAIVALVVLGGVLLFLKKQRDDATPPVQTTSASPGGVNVKTPLEYEQAILIEARRTCTKEDCEAAHVSVTSELREKSPLRQSADFKQIESDWASSTLERADREADPRKKEALLKRVRDTPSVDNDNRNLAGDRLKQLVDVTGDPVEPTTGKDAGPAVDTSATPPKPTTTAPSATAHPTAHATAATTTTTATATATATQTASAPKQSDYDRAMDLAGKGETGRAKQILYGKVVQGRANAQEAGALIDMCKPPNKDVPCLQAACKINNTSYCKGQGY